MNVDLGIWGKLTRVVIFLVLVALLLGVGTILVVIAVALIWPEIRKYGRLDGPT